MNDIKIRVEESANYKGVFFQGKTIRIPLDKSKPITELKYPEFLDVGINSLCYGRCSYCYTCATSKGYNFSNILVKINDFFGRMTLNQRPFQVAIGGSGEATLHPAQYRIPHSRREAQPRQLLVRIIDFDFTADHLQHFAMFVQIRLQKFIEEPARRSVIPATVDHK